MTKSVMTKYQPSVTEWFAAIGKIKDSKIFRKEDNLKAKRLEILYQTIGLPYERPIKMTARDLTDQTPVFKKILKNKGNELCAIRLVPKKGNLPKLRNRGLSIRKCYVTWYKKQKIDPDAYYAYICPHSAKLLWSTIFVINKQAIFGEVIRGLHSQLTHGDTKNKLYQFRYNFRTWQWNDNYLPAKKVIKKITNYLKVPKPAHRTYLKKSLKASFAKNYLTGYFEAVVWPNNKIYIIDYNRVLPKYLPAPSPTNHTKKQPKNVLPGIAVSSGQVQGKVKIIKPKQITNTRFPKNSVLVCENTDARYLPLMKQAAAIITDHGGLLSHAAIISRELNKPCIVDTKKATKFLKNDDLIKVDADNGIIIKIIATT